MEIYRENLKKSTEDGSLEDPEGRTMRVNEKTVKAGWFTAAIFSACHG